MIRVAWLSFKFYTKLNCTLGVKKKKKCLLETQLKMGTIDDVPLSEWELAVFVWWLGWGRVDGRNLSCWLLSFKRAFFISCALTWWCLLLLWRWAAGSHTAAISPTDEANALCAPYTALTDRSVSRLMFGLGVGGGVTALCQPRHVVKHDTKSKRCCPMHNDMPVELMTCLLASAGLCLYCCLHSTMVTN